MTRTGFRFPPTHFFSDKTAVILAALLDFVTNGRFKLIEEQQLADIAWAKSHKPA